jgi:S-adenosylmethionine:tRNA ribosyltransferase-isomerase
MHPRDIRIEDYDYLLPDERIARYPLPQRDASRLLVYSRGKMEEDVYSNIPAHIPSGSLMVFNQTRVVHARLLFTKPSGSTIEVFCLSPHSGYADIQTAMQQRNSVQWECLVGGAAKWKSGMTLTISHNDPSFTLSAVISSRTDTAFILTFTWDTDITFAEVLNHIGKVPLPPYLHRDADLSDEQRYQTTYARDEGSVAAPTAGLHFTDEVMQDLRAAGVGQGFVTLHVGAGTFRPVKSDTMEGHNMHDEWIEVSRDMVRQLADGNNSKIVAVGTTSLRTIESLYHIGNKICNNIPVDLAGIAVTQWEPYHDVEFCTPAQAMAALLSFMEAAGMDKLVTRTQILIAPGYTFRLVDGLVTNFHQPRSTLLLLVSAFIGGDWRKVYSHALEHGYRFLSYGDGSLLWRA